MVDHVVVEVFYTNGTFELFGVFTSHEEGRRWAEGLKTRPNSQVVSYKVRALNKLQ